MPSRRKNSASCFLLGQLVKFGGTPVRKGKIVELRGPLGPGGAAVYRVLPLDDLRLPATPASLPDAD